MTDRYDEAVQGLREAPVPDQWDEVVARASRPPTTPVLELAVRANGNGDGPGRHRGRRWSLALAVAASVAVVVGALALVAREDSDVSTGGPGMTTDTTDTTDASADTTDPRGTAPSSTTPDATPSTTTPPTPPEGRLPSEVVDPVNYPVSACRGLPFAASTPPTGIDSTMQPADPQDPRVPDAVHGNITGVFPGETTTRAVFMVVGWPGLQDDVGTHIPGPFDDVLAWTAPIEDGWLAEIAAPASADTSDTYCPYTVIGLGLTEQDMQQFLAGLTVAE